MGLVDMQVSQWKMIVSSGTAGEIGGGDEGRGIAVPVTRRKGKWEAHSSKGGFVARSWAAYQRETATRAGVGSCEREWYRSQHRARSGQGDSCVENSAVRAGHSGTGTQTACFERGG